MNTTDAFIEARNVSVRFPLPPHMQLGESEVGGRIVQNGRRKELVAVDNVSFRLEAGDSLGLMGHNGSGKTTLLKVLAGILPPTSGQVLYRGSLGNALNTSIGFRAEATGRQNIKLKAIIAGMSGSVIDEVIADVEAFADLGPFLEMPISTYSAGMRARLAFGVATAFRYDILILDEWMGAGDRRMQEKATERMRGFVGRSAITVLASHNTKLLERTCNRIVRLTHGGLETTRSEPADAEMAALDAND